MIDIEAARRHYEDNDSAHGFDHVLRVWRLAERIGQAEGADMEIVKAASLLHDIGRARQAETGMCHAKLGAQWARQILKEHPADRVEAVAQAIAEHRFRGNLAPTRLEAQVLYDADKLDAIGAVGIARAYAIAGARKQHLWAQVPPSYADRPAQEGQGDLENKAHTPIHEYLLKLSKIRDHMYTATGRRLAQERHRYMVQFFERLAREVAGSL